jgi:GrpB-like predicted nucleotidyltransferase (UPF0157 family)
MAASSRDEVLDSFSVVPYDSDWDQWYKQERRAPLDRVPSGFLDLKHIGSTAVPGLDAKPIIDAMAAVAYIDDCESIVLSLEEYGYILIETGMQNRLFFRRRSAKAGSSTFTSSKRRRGTVARNASCATICECTQT